MIDLHFGAEDLSQIRFAFSPVWETVTSLRILSAASPNGVHGRWLERVRPSLGGVDLELLTAVVRPAGYLPDFLHPFPPRRAPSFESGLAEVAAADPRLVAAELAHLVQHPISQEGPGRRRRIEVLRKLVGEPSAGLVRIVTALEGYWRVAIAPDWPRIRALLEADLAYRLDELASGGVRQLFRTLHPSVSLERDTLRIVKYFDGRVDLRGRGLVLVPCAFAWPDVIVRTADPQPGLTYAPRGLGRLWETPSAARTPLADVLGRGRAAILTQLDLPMSTTQLVCHLQLTAPTLNVHLKMLQAAGIVSARRDGRTVLYSRTALGDGLVSAAAEL